MERQRAFTLSSLRTACAATLCAVLYALFGRDPTSACIGCVFGMGEGLEDAWKSGGNRLIGTVLGGLWGMVLVWVHLELGPAGNPSVYLLLFGGVLLLSAVSTWFRWPKAVLPGGVVLCIILFGADRVDPVRYALGRILDTSFGVFLSMCVNLLLPRERVARWTRRLRGEE